MMVEAVHLRSVITNSNLIDRVQQAQQEQQDQNLRHAIHEDLKEYANKKNAVKLTNKVENKIILDDNPKRQGSKKQDQKDTNDEKKEKGEKTGEMKEGSIIDIRI